jgi:hypothetical protein
MRPLTLAMSLACLAGSVSAQANFIPEIFGHDIHISKPEDGGKYHLMIDGASALSDGQVYISEIGVAGDAPYVMGMTGSGGSMCASVPFVVSFASDPPAVDVLPIECGSLAHELKDGEILFEHPGDQDADGLAYLWTPSAGFTEVVASKVDPGSGWEITAPNGCLKYPDTRQQLRDLAGDASEDFFKLISGPPDHTYTGNYLITSNCLSGNCPFGGTLVIADTTSREFYIAWQPTWGAEGDIRPVLSEW